MLPFCTHLHAVVAVTEGKEYFLLLLFLKIFTWTVSSSSHVLLGTYSLPGHGSPGWAQIPEPQGADTAQSYLSGKERDHFSSMAKMHQSEPCSRPPGTQSISTAVVLMDLDKSLRVSLLLFPSCKTEIIILTFFIKCLANARQQPSTITIII